jgi:hypothetical protein
MEFVLARAQVLRVCVRKPSYCATTLPWKSRLTLTDLPSFIALPRQTPLSSFFRSETLE